MNIPTKFTMLPFSFTGKASEYFGIWIVNLLLSIITLGIYTAWAKVRRLRYFYGNTFLDGHNFEYHAKPKQILIGRIIVLAILVLFNILTSFLPILALFLLIPYFAAIPWVINKALSFNARVTSYRNIHFGFEGKYLRALVVFVLMPIAVLFSLGLLAPYGSRMANNYIGSGLRYGTANFETNAPLKALYKNLGATYLFVIIVAIALALIGFLIVLATKWLQMPDSTNAFSLGEAGIGQLVFFAFYAPIIISFIFYRAGVRNIAYNATLLDQQHRFHSEISRLRYLWIIFSNFFLVIISIGLMRPWAAVRTWNYQAEKTALLANGPLDEFISGRQNAGNVATAEFLDVEGIDFGL